MPIQCIMSSKKANQDLQVFVTVLLPILQTECCYLAIAASLVDNSESLLGAIATNLPYYSRLSLATPPFHLAASVLWCWS